jgi:sulfur relay (sulfurtransferase) DsrC/TusE family protein
MNEEQWLRLRALELAVQAAEKMGCTFEHWTIVRLAKEFLDFLETGERP